MHKLIKEFEAAQLKSSVPDFRPGDTVRVSVRIIEGDKQRVQDFQGVCIGRKGNGISESFTVRRVSYGVGMERVFPLNSPRVEKIELVRRGRVRRAKLYFLRSLRGKKARIQEARHVTNEAIAAKAAKKARKIEKEIGAPMETPQPAGNE